MKMMYSFQVAFQLRGGNINGNREHLQQLIIFETSEKSMQHLDLPVENPPTSDHSQNNPASHPDHLGPEFEQPPDESTGGHT
jgi:hypothetical protein